MKILILLIVLQLVFCDKLRFVHVVFRHGDRTPIHPYPTDPYKDRSEWPVGEGQLTSIGKMQHYRLGQWLRDRYGNGKLINEVYSEEEIHVRSTNTDRVLMSAQANLAGLYPPSGYMQWNPDLLWQPIPVHSVPIESDYLLENNHNACPKLIELRKEALESDFITSNLDKHRKLLQYLTLNSGRKINSVEEVDWLYDTLSIEQLYNKTLPLWTNSVFPGGDFEKLRNLAFVVNSLTHQMKRLQAGPILNAISEDWKAVVNGVSGKMKMKMYAGHDTTLSFILNSLNIYDDIPPPYASAVIFELHQDTNNQYSVKILYSTEVGGTPKVLQLPGCLNHSDSTGSCPLEIWSQLTQSVVPDMETWHMECSDVWRFRFQIFDTIFIMLVALFVLSIILYRLQKRHNDYTAL